MALDAYRIGIRNAVVQYVYDDRMNGSVEVTEEAPFMLMKLEPRYYTLDALEAPQVDHSPCGWPGRAVVEAERCGKIVTPLVGVRNDGYVFFVVQRTDGRGLFVCAGCRYFTWEQAIAHWGNPRHPRHAESMQILSVLEGQVRHLMPKKKKRTRLEQVIEGRTMGENWSLEASEKTLEGFLTRKRECYGVFHKSITGTGEYLLFADNFDRATKWTNDLKAVEPRQIIDFTTGEVREAKPSVEWVPVKRFEWDDADPRVASAS